jgi:dihydropyrimidinase
MRTLIKGGTVVTATGSSAADVLVNDEKVAALVDPAHTGALAGAVDQTIDAAGRYVMPGGIDVHTHLEMPFGGTFSADDFETGTRAAAWGGTTSLIDFAVQPRGASLRETLDTWHAKAQGKAGIDYGFHMIISDRR